MDFMSLLFGKRSIILEHGCISCENWTGYCHCSVQGNNHEQFYVKYTDLTLDGTTDKCALLTTKHEVFL